MIGKDENYITGIYTYIYEDEKYYEHIFSCPGPPMALIYTHPNMIHLVTWSPKYQTARSENVHIVPAQKISRGSFFTNGLRACLPARTNTHRFTAADFITWLLLLCWLHDRRSCAHDGQNHVPIFHITSTEGIIDSLNSLDVHNWNLVHYVWTCFMSPDWNDTEYWQSWILLDTKFWNLNAQCRWSRL